MSHEQHIPIHESNETVHFNSEELKRHHERLQEHHEKAESVAKNQRHEHESARHEAKEQAISGAEYHKPHSEQRQVAQSFTKADKLHSFNTTMHSVRSHMNAPERSFSKLIHQPTVEKVSEVAGKTVARPSGIIGATIAAFIGLLSIYSIAKFAGFQLSGSEMPLLLAIGFLIGLLLEWAFKAVRAILTPSRG